MNEEAERFLHQLEKALEGELKSNEIMAEYRMHIDELLQDAAEGKVTYEFLCMRLGSPEELAQLWREEKSVTPRKMQRLFVFLNIALFLGGAIFTLGYNVLGWEWLAALWRALTEATTIIIFIYMFFWALLGYEIGKAFGARGKKILRRTFIVCIIPNLILMYLIVFRLIPYQWFGPLLDGPFVLLCILCTTALYPVSWIGYRWGRKQSV